MTRHKSYETAGARRKKDPVVWSVDGIEVRLRSVVDLQDVIKLLEILQMERTDETVIQYAVNRQSLLLGAVEPFIEEEDLPAYAEIKKLLDLMTLIEMVKDLIAEYAGASNPTKPSSSSDGSEANGETSTDGVPPEASTQ